MVSGVETVEVVSFSGGRGMRLQYGSTSTDKIPCSLATRVL